MKRILSIVITAILAGAFAFTGLAPASASSGKGPLHITKNCEGFVGGAGGYCTITDSNIEMIPIGSRVIYLEAASPTGLDTDIELVTPDGDTAFGHVILHFATGTGKVTFNGGTGTLAGFHAKVAVYSLGGYDWAWKGTYSFDDD